MSRCTYGRKMSGGCKKKPGPKSPYRRRSRSRSRSHHYKKKVVYQFPCVYGFKKDGESCKSKPGRKPM